MEPIKINSKEVFQILDRQVPQFFKDIKLFRREIKRPDVREALINSFLIGQCVKVYVWHKHPAIFRKVLSKFSTNIFPFMNPLHSIKEFKNYNHEKILENILKSAKKKENLISYYSSFKNFVMNDLEELLDICPPFEILNDSVDSIFKYKKS